MVPRGIAAGQGERRVDGRLRGAAVAVDGRNRLDRRRERGFGVLLVVQRQAEVSEPIDLLAADGRALARRRRSIPVELV